MGRADNYSYGDLPARRDDEDHGGGWGAWMPGLLIGAVGGATLALLTAPKSGSEIRGSLERTAKNVPDRVGEVVDDSLDLYASFLNYCQLTLEEQTLRFKRAIAAGKLAAAKKREEIELGGGQLPFQHR